MRPFFFSPLSPRDLRRGAGAANLHWRYRIVFKYPHSIYRYGALDDFWRTKKGLSECGHIIRVKFYFRDMAEIAVEKLCS